MSNYTPDTYQFIRISSESDTVVVTKLFAVWSGGYLDGPAWKLNSGVTKITKEGEMFHVQGYSGSIYIIPANTQPPMTNYGQGILDKIRESATKQEIIVELISSQAAFKEFGE